LVYTACARGLVAPTNQDFEYRGGVALELGHAF
jgi:hypothetical protein